MREIVICVARAGRNSDLRTQNGVLAKVIAIVICEARAQAGIVIDVRTCGALTMVKVIAIYATRAQTGK